MVTTRIGLQCLYIGLFQLEGGILVKAAVDLFDIVEVTVYPDGVEAYLLVLDVLLENININLLRDTWLLIDLKTGQKRANSILLVPLLLTIRKGSCRIQIR
jgi:hypothetical protein